MLCLELLLYFGTFNLESNWITSQWKGCPSGLRDWKQNPGHVCTTRYSFDDSVLSSCQTTAFSGKGFRTRGFSFNSQLSEVNLILTLHCCFQWPPVTAVVTSKATFERKFIGCKFFSFPCGRTPRLTFRKRGHWFCAWGQDDQNHCGRFSALAVDTKYPRASGCCFSSSGASLERRRSPWIWKNWKRQVGCLGHYNLIQ